MLDSVLVANKVIDEFGRNNNKNIILKMDYEKAYDYVRWDFLLYTMERLGLSDKWIMWIKECL